jgi:DNA-binding IscR family transcriptional regulator
MLETLLRLAQQSPGPMPVDELARRAGIDPDVASGMLQTLEALGALHIACESRPCSACRLAEGCPAAKEHPRRSDS